ACDFVGVAPLIRLDVHTADRVSHEDVRRQQRGGAQEVMEIVHRLLDRVLFGASVAPREAGAVVGADAREWRDFLLDQRPLDGEAAAAALGDDRWRRRADAADMEPAAADIDELSRG